MVGRMRDFEQISFVKLISSSKTFGTRALMLSILATSLAVVSPAQALDIGQKAPNFALTSSNSGKALNLSEFAGEVVYVDFWASWCATCAQSLGWLTELQDKFGKHGFRVVTINVDEDRNDALRLLEEAKAKLLVGFDPEGVTPELYEVQGMPSSVLIDRSGNITAVHTGLNDSEKQEIEAKIQKVLQQKI